MKVTEVAVGKIKRYGNNPRRNADSVAAIRKSLETFGFRQPIVVDKHNVIIVGDTRYQAALSAGFKTVPVHVATDLSPTQVKAYRLADNKLGEISEWDDAKLMQEIIGLQESKVDFSVIGFNAAELEALKGKDKPPPVLEDFTISPTGRTHWIVVHATEKDSARVLQAIRKLKLLGLHMEYSGDKEASSAP